ncbi:MAG TPA: MaoC/PaaZ C-terminal domain-containing protein [Polyangiaceae bacterium]|nr:MAG: MaoC like domain protein [Deltaproteobacteria bacterium ADurb.Bin207]HNS96906.1 MaoC/PaaZ C-terminal domain-containing protein [Polyangiaceae bacterium]HNZ21060.1 MaoC/PaaZ C-terminal domain-containing protein [Polyangiaceae bacterium]HOD22315.1 MaoC/PaaZ C-terminal domain-containing protein [Polyangiaceae bacterium]HOE47830.1 MaoC/PaaZ C-terminal domain-containing protein [Polyangiaceae bacterium]
MHPRIRKLRTIATFGQVWASGFTMRLGLRAKRDRMLRPRISGVVPAFSEAEIERYILSTGGALDEYRDSDGSLLIPPTYFATWGLAELGKALLASCLPLNFSRVVHASSRVRVHRLQKVNEPARFSATVETVVRTGKKVRIEQQLTTMTPEAQPLAEHTVALVIPDGRSKRRTEQSADIVPVDSTLLSAIRLPPHEGWRYARLSGDFNPIHWASPIAKLLGWRGPIAHGFDLMARTCHASVRHLAQGDARKLRKLDVTFRRPVHLPAELHLFAGQATAMGQTKRVLLWVGAEQEAPAKITGHVEVDG